MAESVQGAHLTRARNTANENRRENIERQWSQHSRMNWKQTRIRTEGVDAQFVSDHEYSRVHFVDVDVIASRVRSALTAQFVQKSGVKRFERGDELAPECLRDS